MKKRQRSHIRLLNAIKKKDLETIKKLIRNGYLNSNYLLVIEHTLDLGRLFESMISDSNNKFSVGRLVESKLDGASLNGEGLDIASRELRLSSKVFQNKLIRNKALTEELIRERFETLRVNGELVNTIFNLDDFDEFIHRLKVFIKRHQDLDILNEVRGELERIDSEVLNIIFNSKKLSTTKFDFKLYEVTTDKCKVYGEDEDDILEVFEDLTELKLQFKADKAIALARMIQDMVTVRLKHAIETVFKNFVKSEEEMNASQQFEYLKTLLLYKINLEEKYSIINSRIESFPNNLNVLKKVLNLEE